HHSSRGDPQSGGRPPRRRGPRQRNRVIPSAESEFQWRKRMQVARGFVRTVFFLIVILSAASAFAQQTGSIQGKVTDNSGGVLPGVTVEPRSALLPSARVTTTGSDGTFRLPQLPPGDYTLTYTLSGMQ